MDELDIAAEFEQLNRRREWAGSVGKVFAERLRHHRGSTSQQHVALLMVVMYGHTTWHQTTVAKVEAGDREVKLAEAVALAEIVRTPLSTLIGAEDGEHPEEA